MLNMFGMDCQPTIVKSVINRLKSADSSVDSNTDPPEVGAWVWAFKSAFLLTFFEIKLIEMHEKLG